MMKSLILGVGGQDGSYLADILLAKGHEVHGLYRRSSYPNLSRIDHIIDKVHLWNGDMADPVSIHNAIDQIRPDVIYNEADQDSVGWSMANVAYTMDITASAVGRLLEIVRTIDQKIKVFQPCTAMMFGDAAKLSGETISPQNENTPFCPQSPYACAKVAAYYLARYYRQEYGMFVSTGILYNHDSPRRTEHYLLHKICKAAVAISRDEQKTLALGNLDARVDIGYAKEHMTAATQIMELSDPDDFVIGTETAHSIQGMVDVAFNAMGICPWKDCITVDEKFFKATPKSVLVADCTKLRKATGWKATSDSKTMVTSLVTYFSTGQWTLS